MRTLCSKKPPRSWSDPRRFASRWQRAYTGDSGELRGPRCCDAAQFLEHNRAGPRIGMAVVEQLGCPVRTHGHGMNLESQACGIDLGVEVPSLLRLVHGTRDDRNPFVHDRRDAVVNRATPAIELKGGGAEEAASGKEAFFNQNQPLLQQAPQTRHSLGCSEGRPRNLLYENRARCFDRG